VILCLLVLLVENAKLAVHQPAAPKTILAVLHVRAIFHKSTVRHAETTPRLITINRQAAHIHELRAHRAQAIQSRLGLGAGKTNIRAVFVVGKHVTIFAILGVVDVIPARALAMVNLLRPMPRHALHHLRKILLGPLPRRARSKIPLSLFGLKLLASQLLIGKTILFISKIKAKEAIRAVPTVIQKAAIMNIFAIQQKETTEAIRAVDHVRAHLRVE